jgi:hypothetical protein
MHGSFSQAILELHGGDRPDFKSGYVDPLPVSNADAAPPRPPWGSRKRQRKLDRPRHDRSHAERQRRRPCRHRDVAVGERLRTVLNFQRVKRHFDAAGFPGRTLGLDAGEGKQKTAGK